MEFEAYIDAAARTAPANLARPELLADVALGLCGEAGEIQCATGAQLDTEIGDGWWYVAVGHRTLGAAPTDPCADLHEPDSPLRRLFVAGAAVAERAKKVRYHGEPIDEHRSSLLEQFTRYAAGLSAATATPDRRIWESNVAKLARRYPEGFPAK